ncbi:hypothetical protein B0T17DRAFT_600593 [Bombardia bombarda]|uniref:G-protein coupled receptors family 2 profile 2 domain-containing protein n=1 Tax=Bombardia bombarda TaxID=252184 RepID=A0AA39WUE8_9PEZI|nr:hypothetical protein B0T17DRAFT_600593 [Bombardia bombarda]
MAILTEPQLSLEQIRQLLIIERVFGIISFLSQLSIFICYGLFKPLRTMPNTLLMLCSTTSLVFSVVVMIGYNGILAGEKSGLCQAQAMLSQWAMPSSAWWSLAMAINVLLVFLPKYRPRYTKRWYFLHLFICSGVQLLIALFLPFAGYDLWKSNHTKSFFYGPANVWCWITVDWVLFRLVNYIQVWFCFVTSLLIYIVIGIYVFRERNKLKQLCGDLDSNLRRNAPDHTAARAELSNIRTSTYNTITDNNHESQRRSPLHSTLPVLAHPINTGKLCCPPKTQPPSTISPSSTNNSGSIDSVPILSSLPPFPPQASIEILDTRPERPQNPDKPTLRSHRTAPKTFTSFLDRFGIEDPVKRAYLRSSALYSITLFITYLPSSINRFIQIQLRGPSPAFYGLNTAQAVAIPLGGIMNAVIFFTLSWPTFKNSVRDAMAGRGHSHHQQRDPVIELGGRGAEPRDG